MKFILGKKTEMSQIFQDDKVVPVTEIQAGPCLVTQVKSREKDGYQAVQIAFGKKKKISRSLTGHLKDSKAGQEYNRYLREFRVEKNDLKVGDKITADVFQPDDKVKISGFSKGKGFQGVVKKHGFRGSPASHGHKDQLRMPGSIGSTGPARVFKGRKMPGHMGDARITVKNLRIINVDPEKNTILVKGAVPGPRNGLLEIIQM